MSVDLLNRANPPIVKPILLHLVIFLNISHCLYSKSDKSLAFKSSNTAFISSALFANESANNTRYNQLNRIGDNRENRYKIIRFENSFDFP